MIIIHKSCYVSVITSQITGILTVCSTACLANNIENIKAPNQLPFMTSGFPSQSNSSRANISMSWHHQWFRQWLGTIWARHKHWVGQGKHEDNTSHTQIYSLTWFFCESIYMYYIVYHSLTQKFDRFLELTLKENKNIINMNAILRCTRQGPVYPVLSISWLLMTWRRKEPGHQQP